jgi:hypothetical protein
MSMGDLGSDIRTRYEPNVFNSVRKLLPPGSLIFDVGAYDGITSDILATIVGPENVVIVEPGEMDWATIWAYWNAHGHGAPRATYAGFLNDSDRPGLDPRSVVHVGKFPPEADQSIVAQAEEGLNFRLLSDREKYPEVMARPWLKLDTVTSIVGSPAGVVMDVEGAELLVLRGAEETLRSNRPFVWAEIHPKLMHDFFMMSDFNLHVLMQELGYQETLLGSKINEEHWLFVPEEHS